MVNPNNPRVNSESHLAPHVCSLSHADHISPDSSLWSLAAVQALQNRSNLDGGNLPPKASDRSTNLPPHSTAAALRMLDISQILLHLYLAYIICVARMELLKARRHEGATVEVLAHCACGKASGMRIMDFAGTTALKASPIAQSVSLRSGRISRSSAVSFDR